MDAYYNNMQDSGKVVGSANDDDTDQIMENYTGADNDDFMQEMIDSFCTKEEATSANPTGIRLTKFNAPNATRRFIQTALKLNPEQQDAWMSKYFEKAWHRYDVGNQGYI